MQSKVTGAFGAVLLLGLGGCSGITGDGPSGDDEPLGVTAEARPSASNGATNVAIGGWHRCAILEGGHVKCWGVDSAGAVGQGDISSRGARPNELGDHLPPVRLGLGRTAKALAAGSDSTCAILDNDLMKCWGSIGRTVFSENGGALGNEPGEMGDNLPYVPVGTGRTVKAVSMGVQFQCAILDTNELKCWGWGSMGRLGNGSTNSIDLGQLGGDNVPAVNLGTGRSVKSVSVGYEHSCAILDTNQVKCWGANGHGRLGLGDTSHRGDGPGEMGDALQPVNLGTGRSAKAVSAGHYSTCAILDNDRVKCWGANGAGELGVGDTQSRGDGPNEMGDSLPYVQLGPGITAKAIGVSGFNACALLNTDQVKCWGHGGEGNLGQGDEEARGDQFSEVFGMPPIALGTGRTVVAIAVGNAAGQCAVLDNGDLKCWGDNAEGRLGLGDTSHRGDAPGEMGDALPAVPLGSPTGGLGYATVAAGGAHSCSIRGDNQIKCWGSNAFGQLGIGNHDTRGDQPNEILALPPVALGTGRSARRIAVGKEHSCAVLDNGKVKCWGRNGHGQLGVGHILEKGGNPGDLGDSLQYAELGTGRLATELDVGAGHTCVLLDTNQVKCWGFSGATGLGTDQHYGDGPNEMGDHLPAVQLAGNAKSLSAGMVHTCAVIENGRLQCWGVNTWGQLGLGHTSSRGKAPGDMQNLPFVSLGTAVAAVEVSAGTGHTCVRFSDGRVKCFGRNTYGELGLGDTQHRGDGPNEMGDGLPYVNLGTGRTARALTTGNGFTCAWLDNNLVKCWGTNIFGKLGLGSTTARGDGPNEMGDNLPFVNLGANTSTRKLSIGDEHACARTHDTQIKCWGGNLLGRLGLGDTQHRGDQANEMGDLLPTLPFSAP